MCIYSGQWVGRVGVRTRTTPRSLAAQQHEPPLAVTGSRVGLTGIESPCVGLIDESACSSALLDTIRYMSAQSPPSGAAEQGLVVPANGRVGEEPRCTSDTIKVQGHEDGSHCK